MLKTRHKFAIAFACSWGYWIYLIFNSHMVVRFDAIGYEELGTMIHAEGWQAYFKTGPHREPFYPALISISMDLAQQFNISYQMILKLFQVAFLFISQCLMLVLMDRLKIRPFVQVAMLLYVGFSPALVNSAFSLFAEIITYPFVLLIVLCLSESVFVLLKNDSYSKLMMMALLTVFAFLGAAFNKGIFIYIFYVGLLCMLGMSLWMGVSSQRPKAMRILIYTIICAISFSVPITAFKKANQKYNGQYAFTNRFSELLFGNAYKRAQPLTPRILMAHLTSIPGGGVCRKFFSEEECRYCEFYAADDFRGAPLDAKIGQVSEENRDTTILKLSMEYVLQHPFQYILFMGIESSRMFFWESTQIGFVEYSPILTKLFNQFLFKDALRLSMSILTIIAFYLLLMRVLRKETWSPEKITQIIIFLVVIVYMGMHSFFSVITRYALPIAPLYLLIIACLFNQFKLKREKNV